MSVMIESVSIPAVVGSLGQLDRIEERECFVNVSSDVDWLTFKTGYGEFIKVRSKDLKEVLEIYGRS